MSEKLKPCPFCGKKIHICRSLDRTAITSFFCQGCGAMVKFPRHGKDSASLLEAWNSRAEVKGDE